MEFLSATSGLRPRDPLFPRIRANAAPVPDPLGRGVLTRLSLSPRDLGRKIRPRSAFARWPRRLPGRRPGRTAKLGRSPAQQHTDGRMPARPLVGDRREGAERRTGRQPEPQAERGDPGTGRKTVVLGIPHLALRDRVAPIRQVEPVDPEVPALPLPSEPGGPGREGIGRRAVPLVQEAFADVAGRSVNLEAGHREESEVGGAAALEKRRSSRTGKGEARIGSGDIRISWEVPSRQIRQISRNRRFAPTSPLVPPHPADSPGVPSRSGSPLHVSFAWTPRVWTRTPPLWAAFRIRRDAMAQITRKPTARKTVPRGERGLFRSPGP